MLTLKEAEKELRSLRKTYRDGSAQLHIKGQGDHITRSLLELPSGLAPGVYELAVVVAMAEDGIERVALKDTIEIPPDGSYTPPAPDPAPPALPQGPEGVMLRLFDDLRGEVKELRTRDDRRKDDHYQAMMKLSMDFQAMVVGLQQQNWEFLKTSQAELHANIRQEVRAVTPVVERAPRNMEEAVARLVERFGPQGVAMVIEKIAASGGKV